METKSKDIALEKKRIRSLVLQKRSAMTEEDRVKASKNVFEKLIETTLFKESSLVLCFVSYETEIDTYDFIEYCFRTGKRVFVPRVLSAIECSMDFFEIHSFDELKSGYKGIPEPLDSVELYPENQGGNVTMMVMPGSAFDSMNHRMGYGKGFYDRFLAKHRGLVERTVGIGFRCQKVEMVPCEAFDIALNMIIVDDITE